MISTVDWHGCSPFLFFIHLFFVYLFIYFIIIIISGMSLHFLVCLDDVIKWPERHQLQQMAERWQRRAGFPGVVGAIDGTYIKIPGPRDETRDSFICRKGYPAMQLQVLYNPIYKWMQMYYFEPASPPSLSLSNTHTHTYTTINKEKEKPEESNMATRIRIGRLPFLFHFILNVGR